MNIFFTRSTAIFLSLYLAFPAPAYALRSMSGEGAGAEQIRRELAPPIRPAGMEEGKSYDEATRTGQDNGKRFRRFRLFEDRQDDRERSAGVYLRMEQGQEVLIPEGHPALLAGFRVADPTSEGDWFVFVRNRPEEARVGALWELKEDDQAKIRAPNDTVISPTVFRANSIRMELRAGEGILVRAEGGPILLERLPGAIEFPSDRPAQQIFASELRHRLDDLLLPGEKQEEDISSSLFENPKGNYRLLDNRNFRIMRAPITQDSEDPRVEKTGLVGILPPESWSQENLLELTGLPLEPGRDSQPYPIMRYGGRLQMNAAFGEDVKGHLFIRVGPILKEDLSDALELLVDLMAKLMKSAGRQGPAAATWVDDLKKIIESKENRNVLEGEGYRRRFAAVTALLFYEDEAAVKTLLPLIDPTGQWDPSYSIRQAIVKGLADRHHMGREPGREKLRLKEKDWKEIREVLVRILVGEKDHPKRRDPRPRVRWTAIQTLTRLTPIGSERETVPILEVVAQNDPSEYVRHEAGHMIEILKQQQIRLESGEGPMPPVIARMGPPSDAGVARAASLGVPERVRSPDPRVIGNKVLFDIVWDTWMNSEDVRIPLSRLILQENPDQSLRLYLDDDELGIELERSARQGQEGLVTLSAFLSEGRWDRMRLGSFLQKSNIREPLLEGRMSPPVTVVSAGGLPVSIYFSFLDTGLLIQSGSNPAEEILGVLPVLVDTAVRFLSASAQESGWRGPEDISDPRFRESAPEIRREIVRELILRFLTGRTPPKERRSIWLVLAGLVTAKDDRRDPDDTVREMAVRGLGLLTGPEEQELRQGSTIANSIMKGGESERVRLAADEVFIKLEDAYERTKPADVEQAGLEESPKTSPEEINKKVEALLKDLATPDKWYHFLWGRAARNQALRRKAMQSLFDLYDDPAARPVLAAYPGLVGALLDFLLVQEDEVAVGMLEFLAGDDTALELFRPSIPRLVRMLENADPLVRGDAQKIVSGLAEDVRFGDLFSRERRLIPATTANLAVSGASEFAEVTLSLFAEDERFGEDLTASIPVLENYLRRKNFSGISAIGVLEALGRNNIQRERIIRQAPIVAEYLDSEFSTNQAKEFLKMAVSRADLLSGQDWDRIVSLIAGAVEKGSEQAASSAQELLVLCAGGGIPDASLAKSVEAFLILLENKDPFVIARAQSALAIAIQGGAGEDSAIASAAETAVRNLRFQTKGAPSPTGVDEIVRESAYDLVAALAQRKVAPDVLSGAVDPALEDLTDDSSMRRERAHRAATALLEAGRVPSGHLPEVIAASVKNMGFQHFVDDLEIGNQVPVHLSFLGKAAAETLLAAAALDRSGEAVRGSLPGLAALLSHPNREIREGALQAVRTLRVTMPAHLWSELELRVLVSFLDRPEMGSRWAFVALFSARPRSPSYQLAITAIDAAHGWRAWEAGSTLGVSYGILQKTEGDFGRVPDGTTPGLSFEIGNRVKKIAGREVSDFWLTRLKSANGPEEYFFLYKPSYEAWSQPQMDNVESRFLGWAPDGSKIFFLLPHGEVVSFPQSLEEVWPLLESASRLETGRLLETTAYSAAINARLASAGIGSFPTAIRAAPAGPVETAPVNTVVIDPATARSIGWPGRLQFTMAGRNFWEILEGIETEGLVGVSKSGLPPKRKRGLTVDLLEGIRAGRVQVSFDGVPTSDPSTASFSSKTIIAFLWNVSAAGMEERKLEIREVKRDDNEARERLGITRDADAVVVTLPATLEPPRLSRIFAHADLSALLVGRVSPQTSITPLMHPSRVTKVSPDQARKLVRVTLTKEVKARNQTGEGGNILVLLHSKWVKPGEENQWVPGKKELPEDVKLATLNLSESVTRGISGDQLGFLWQVALELGWPLAISDFERRQTAADQVQLVLYL